jgi:hypothetical protein
VTDVGSGDAVDVRGRHLYVEYTGSGTPTVLLEAGFGGASGSATRSVQGSPSQAQRFAMGGTSGGDETL